MVFLYKIYSKTGPRMYLIYLLTYSIEQLFAERIPNFLQSNLEKISKMFHYWLRVSSFFTGVFWFSSIEFGRCLSRTIDIEWSVQTWLFFVLYTNLTFLYTDDSNIFFLEFYLFKVYLLWKVCCSFSTTDFTSYEQGTYFFVEKLIICRFSLLISLYFRDSLF